MTMDHLLPSRHEKYPGEIEVLSDFTIKCHGKEFLKSFLNHVVSLKKNWDFFVSDKFLEFCDKDDD